MPESTGFFDSRMTASSTPPTTPISMDSAVSSRVTQMPCTTVGSRSVAPTKSQSSAGLVSRTCSSIAPSTATTATETQRPGWRTGTALMVSGRPRSADP
ncbi:hypothetical protein [Kitasatospora saccharophila]